MTQDTWVGILKDFGLHLNTCRLIDPLHPDLIRGTCSHFSRMTYGGHIARFDN